MLWRTLTRTFDLSRRALIMGVVNVTTDSFSDGGRFAETDAAVSHALQLAEEGAEIIDIGGESTRPGAEPATLAEESSRVLPVIERLAAHSHFVLSIDTMKPAVARAAIERGAAIVNDVSGLRDPAMREVLRTTGAGAIAMHMQGEPRTMQQAPHYHDVCGEIREFFRQTFERCLRCGIDPMCLAFDPGIGFGKTLAHNLALIRNLGSLRIADRPLVLGASRKSFMGKVLGTEQIADREWPTVALTSFGRQQSANIFRVHSVRPNSEALRMTEAILHSGEPA
ncbi:MAG TPA: dihydropteroate synthase [Chthoniobacteraceae bacterium]|jgi:dihydropteroate synthase